MVPYEIAYIRSRYMFWKSRAASCKLVLRRWPISHSLTSHEGWLCYADFLAKSTLLVEQLIAAEKLHSRMVAAERNLVWDVSCLFSSSNVRVKMFPFSGSLQNSGMTLYVMPFYMRVNTLHHKTKPRIWNARSDNKIQQQLRENTSNRAERLHTNKRIITAAASVLRMETESRTRQGWQPCCSSCQLVLSPNHGFLSEFEPVASSYSGTVSLASIVFISIGRDTQGEDAMLCGVVCGFAPLSTQ